MIQIALTPNGIAAQRIAKAIDFYVTFCVFCECVKCKFITIVHIINFVISIFDWNIFIICPDNIFFKKKINILYLLFIGITVQLGWETALLVTGIRQSGMETLVINSLIETNLGLPYIYHIHKYIDERFGKEKRWKSYYKT